MRGLLKFLDGVFNLRTPRGLLGLLPHLFTDMEAHPDWFNVITCEGRIVSHVGVTPLEFVMGERRMTVGAIGHVATAEKYREKGLMAALLEYATARMRDEKMPVSILWGDKVRYARFGWEPAGQAHHFSLTPRTASALSRYKDRVTRLENPVRHAAKMHALQRLLPLRVERTPATFSLMLEREGIAVFAAMRGKRLSAYVVAREQGEGGGGEKGRTWTVVEACGSGPGVLSILRWLAGRPGVRAVEGSYPLLRLPISDSLLEAGSSWRSPVAMIGQIKIIDLAGALASFGLGSFEDKVRKLGYDGRKLVRTIFGPVPPRVTLPPGAAYAGLAARLPVDFYLWPSDHC